MRQPNEAMVNLLNEVVSPSRVIAHMVPTRIFRIVQADIGALTFRVEQLVEHSGFGTFMPKGSWVTISTHGGKQAGVALGVAFKSAAESQQQFIHKLRQRLEARNPKLIKV